MNGKQGMYVTNDEKGRGGSSSLKNWTIIHKISKGK
jgi:hypothetical protein